MAITATYRRGGPPLWLIYLLAFAAFVVAGVKASAATLSTYAAWCAANPDDCHRGTYSVLGVRGLADGQAYVLQADPTTGALPVSGTFTATFNYDENYGVVGATTLRTASQLGNATGAADFGQGAVSAQTLRTVSVLSNGTAALATGGGTTGSAVLRVVLPTDQTAIPATESGTWTVQPGNTANTTPWLESISSGGNTATVSVAGALKVDGSAVTQPISAASLPLPTGASTAANQTTGNSTLSTISGQLPATLGAKATAASMAVNIASDQVVPISSAGRAKCLVYRNDYGTTPVTTGAYVQAVASTSCAVNRLYIFDSSGSVMKIAVGGAGSEVDQIYLPPGGSGVPYELNIPSGSRVAIEALDTNATAGQIVMTGLQ